MSAVMRIISTIQVLVYKGHPCRPACVEGPSLWGTLLYVPFRPPLTPNRKRVPHVKPGSAMKGTAYSPSQRCSSRWGLFQQDPTRRSYGATRRRSYWGSTRVILPRRRWWRHCHIEDWRRLYEDDNNATVIFSIGIKLCYRAICMYQISTVYANFSGFCLQAKGCFQNWSTRRNKLSSLHISRELSNPPAAL